MSAKLSHINNIHEAKTHLSQLIHFAEMGDEVVICRAGKPAVKLVPVELTLKKRRTPGQLRGKMTVADDFDVFPAVLKTYFGIE